MYELDKSFLEQLEAIADEIQESDDLARYLESEEEDDYNILKEAFEPRIGLVYDEVARKFPLQLIALELVLLEPVFEGLFLPRILGYSVLRGEISEKYKYVRPQDHFREVLLAICNSANYDLLRKRIGQTIQIGFALSSDIWVTNLINEISNKKIRYFLQAQKLDRYRDIKERARGYRRYKYQFRNEVFMTASFPENKAELPIYGPQLKQFLIYRINLQEDNSSLIPSIREMIGNEDFYGTPQHLDVTCLFGYFFDLDDDSMVLIADVINEFREKDADFSEKMIKLINDMHHNPEIDLTPEAEQQFSELLDDDIQDELGRYYELVNQIHTTGYLQPEVHDKIKTFYNQHEGLSLINDNLRQTVFAYFARLIRNLDTGAYADYFEITKYFPIYMKIFANQQFNQDLKELSMAYVKRLLKTYTDKRGKDYQDIKKFVRTNFVEFGFLKEKEVVELFKTKRKKKKTA